MSPGDVSGFAALILIGLTALFMLVRSKLLAVTKNLNAVRVIHVATATLAGVFLVVHITYLFTPPVSYGVVLGYAALATSVVVWLSGTAFLKRLRDSLFFHGTLTSVLVGLSLAHAASVSPNIPLLYSQVMLAATGTVMIGNASFQLHRALFRS